METPIKEALLEFYHTAFHALDNYVYLLDNEGHLVSCNDNLLKVLNQEQITTNAVGVLYTLMLENHFGNQRQLAMHKKADIEALVSEQPVNAEKPVDFWLNKEKTHLFNVTRTPLHSSSGQPLGLLVEMTDVTETIYLQEQVDKIRKELEHRNTKAVDNLAYSVAPHASKPKEDMLEQSSPLVLIIEDDDIAQKAAKSVLMHCNFDVHLAHDEDEFKTMFTPGKYQLVLMDIGLEDTSGYMIAKEIRKLEHDTEFNVPIIALTGYDPKHLAGDCDYYSMEGAIQKPLTVEQVAQINQRYIRNIDIKITGFEPARPIE